MAAKKEESTVPVALKPAYEAVTLLTDEFCKLHFDDECAELARKITATLCRKRPSPMLVGRHGTWASAIIHAMSTVNFLFDKSNGFKVKAPDLAAHFGLSSSTIANKSREIRTLLKMNFMDWKFMLPSKVEDSSMAWYISVDGMMVDARFCIRDVQEQAFEKGLIPYIYVDRHGRG